MFIHGPLPVQPRPVDSVMSEPITSVPVATTADLALELIESSTGIGGHFIYHRDLWERATIERMAGHFLTLLAGIVADAGQSIGKLPLLTELERQQLLVTWNGPAVAYPREKCVHELFEEQVERAPDAVAVVFESQELTYRELNARRGPARALSAKSWRRTADNGGAVSGALPGASRRHPRHPEGRQRYVPVDPIHPPRRLQFMLSHARVGLVVTHHHLLGGPCRH